MNFVWKLKTVALCCFLVACIGCASPATNNSNSSNSAGSASGGGAAATAPANEKPVDSISRAMRAQYDAKSFRARMEASFDGQNSTRVLEYVAPDRFHMTSDMDEIIIIGPATYRRTKGGRWQKFPADVGGMVTSFRDPKLIEELSKSTDVKFLGTDVLDGTPTLIYQYTLANAFGSGITSTSKTWIGAADSLPRKAEIEGEINKQKTKTTITYYDYNVGINIEPPI